MAYATFSVVFGEQPSAAKWNILGTNDAYFNTQIGSNFSSGTASTVWWEELGRLSLGSGGDTITISPIAARKFLEIEIYCLPTGGTIRPSVTFNNDTGANYYNRQSANGAADSSTSAANLINTAGGANNGPYYQELKVTNYSAQEKLVIYHDNDTTSGNVPGRTEGTAKWANTSAQITRVDITNNGGTGDFAATSVGIVRGHD